VKDMLEEVGKTFDFPVHVSVHPLML